MILTKNRCFVAKRQGWLELARIRAKTIKMIENVILDERKVNASEDCMSFSN